MRPHPAVSRGHRAPRAPNRRAAYALVVLAWLLFYRLTAPACDRTGCGWLSCTCWSAWPCSCCARLTKSSATLRDSSHSSSSVRASQTNRPVQTANCAG